MSTPASIMMMRAALARDEQRIAKQIAAKAEERASEAASIAETPEAEQPTAEEAEQPKRRGRRAR